MHFEEYFCICMTWSCEWIQGKHLTWFEPLYLAVKISNVCGFQRFLVHLKKLIQKIRQSSTPTNFENIENMVDKRDQPQACSWCFWHDMHNPMYSVSLRDKELRARRWQLYTFLSFLPRNPLTILSAYYLCDIKEEWIVRNSHHESSSFILEA